MSRASERIKVTTGANGTGSEPKMQGTLEHLPLDLPRKQWLKTTLQKVSGRMVRKTPDGSFQVNKAVAGIFISAFLSLLITGGLGLLWQRDEIVRLRTLQEVQDKTNADMLSKIDQAKNTAMIADRNAARIEGKFDQFAQVFAIKNADKAKLQLLPE
jgi:hypothetical protein